MYRKIGVIFLLTVALGAILYLRPWISQKEAPNFLDRLPDAEIIGHTDLLELSKTLKSTAYYYKIPFREFVSPDFILSQGKGYGLDVQKPVYFFGNEKNEELNDWGVLVHVKDSSKLGVGIQTLMKLSDIHDTLIGDHRGFIHPNTKLAISYGRNWLLICSSNKLASHVPRINDAQSGHFSPRWKEFLQDSSFSNKPIVAHMESPHLRKMGIESIGCAATNDSASIMFHSAICQSDSLSFSLKSVGPSLQLEEYTRHLVNMHFDTQRLGTNSKDPLYVLLKKVSSKVSFPLADFLSAWDGDIAFRQGGIQLIREKYVTSELDDNFNVTEVEKYKQIKISGFSLYLSTNEKQKELLSSLYKKGIMTSDGKKVRLLYSPPMNLKQSDTSLFFHTSRYAPIIYMDSAQYGTSMHNYTPIDFSIDSTSTKTIYGRIRLPLKKIINDNMPSNEL